MKTLALLLYVFTCLSCGIFQSPKEKKKVVTVEVPAQPGQPVPGSPSIDPPRIDFVSFDLFEAENLSDNTSLNSAKQVNARYLTLCNHLNDGSLTEELRLGVQKAVNSITREVLIEPGVWVGDAKCTLRVDCRDFNLCGDKWRLIEEADGLKFESFTDRGLLLKQLTKARRPWIHAANFLEITLRNDVYYDLLEIPDNIDDFLNTYLGCNLQRDFDDFNQDLFLAGVRRSRISIQKNRNLLFTQCRDGAVSITYDTILENVTSAGRNLSINPFPVEARTAKTFQHDASEFIFNLPNRMLGFALFNADGQRETFAPTNIVIDVARTDLGGEIQNSRSCFSCHSTGYLEAKDFIADHIRGNSSFDSEEIQKGLAYFGRNEAMTAAMRQANQRYANALGLLRIDPTLDDPINLLTDKIRREMALKQVAALLFLSEDEFRTLLPQSQVGVLAVGQLLTGGAVNFQDFTQVAGVLVDDLNLFKEALGQ